MAKVTSAVRSKAIVKREVSTSVDAGSLPLISMGRVGQECKRASDLRKNCES